MKAVSVYYTGKVQGVGFRATAAMTARDHAVTGWVKNLDDGRVEMFVEGSEEAIEKYLQSVRAWFKRNIEKEEVDQREPTGKFKSFEVTH